MSQFIVSIVTILVLINVILLSVAYCILLERKIAAWVQDRIGPNRVGFSFGLSFMPRFHFWGLGQPLADGLKFLLKEDYIPSGVDRPLFLLAPAVVIAVALMGFAVMPWGGYLQWGDEVLNVTGAPIGIGVIYLLAVGSMAVYGVVVGGYASNNKYSFLGGMRATAQMLSYEIPLSLCVLIVVLMSASARPDVIVAQQVNGVWNLFTMPLLAVIFFTCNLAECNRAPFDLAEAEQELVGGYHTEYSSMKFALFFLAEYTHMITSCAFFTVMFLGGWDLMFVKLPAVGGIGLVLLKVGVFGAKIFLLIALMMLIRWTLPRFRFDQLMRLAWRGLIPVTLVLLLAAGWLVFFGVEGWVDRSAVRWWMLGVNVVVFIAAMVIAPLIPAGPPVNRRVELEGSRFSPVRDHLTV